MARKDNRLNNTREEFKISISTDDVDNIEQQIKNIKNVTKQFEEFNTMETYDDQ